MNQQYQLFPELDGDSYAALKRDIEERGILVPVELDEQGNILDGHHRVRIAEELGLTDYPRIVRIGWDDQQKRNHVRALNILRRHLSKEQCLPHWLDMRREGMPYSAIAQTSGVDKETVRTAVSEYSPTERVTGRDGKSYPATKPRAVIASTPHETETALAAAQKTPELLDGLVTARDAGKIVREETRRENLAAQVEAIESGKAELPTGLFEVIVIDPPWPYEKRKEDPTHRARLPYPDMTMEDIEDLEIPAADDSILWLWTTNAFMHTAYHLAYIWGFEVKTILTWTKDRMGVGDWLRGRTEHCLMCVKGRPIIRLTNQTTSLSGEVREHSRKPDSFYELVDALCVGRKLDYFSREPREGWEQYGNDTTRF